MPKSGETEKPRIFISHAWEDKPLVRRLEAELMAAGAEVWVDHEGIRGGDNLPERISEALEWCNTLLLVWSAKAKESRWVKMEWTNAISLEKAIIPCRLDATPLPAILANKAYLDFSDTERGLAELLRALKLARKSLPTVANDPVEKVARAIHGQLSISNKRDSDKKSTRRISISIEIVFGILISVASSVFLKVMANLSVWQSLGIALLVLILILMMATRGKQFRNLALITVLLVTVLATVYFIAARHDQIQNSSPNQAIEESTSKQLQEQEPVSLVQEKTTQGSPTIITETPAQKPENKPTQPALKKERVENSLKPPLSERSLSLRKSPTTLTAEQVKSMLRKYRFYCREYDWNKEWSNPQGEGVDNKLEVQQDGKVVFDYATGLMWQQSGSLDAMTYVDAANYIRELNDQGYAGHSDWRLPTLEEAMSLMEPIKHGDFFVDAAFDRQQYWIWTADTENSSSAWSLGFSVGSCAHGRVVQYGYYCVRAVRNEQ